MKKTAREVVTTVIISIAIFFTLQNTIQNFYVIGSSMEPSLEPGQRLLVNRVFYRFNEPERGDIIVFVPPQNGKADFIKRIIGLPGDSVVIANGTVYINGMPLEEPYIKAPLRYDMGAKVISQDKYFVLGDNRNHSNDSHNGWTVEEDAIVGKAWISIWPLERWGMIEHHSY